jgi:large subunit ribosomal protein L46
VADEKNDTKSVLRQLDKSLFLTVQRQLGDTLFWDLPTVFNAKGESLRDSAQRAIVDHCGSKFSAQVLGNAPFAHFKVKYPKRIQEDSGHRGEKAFIYKAYYIQDQSSKLDLNTDLCKDFQWLNRNELCEILDPRVRKSLLQVLYANED